MVELCLKLIRSASRFLSSRHLITEDNRKSLLQFLKHLGMNKHSWWLKIRCLRRLNRVHGKYLVGANFSRNFSFCGMRPNQIITKNKTKTTIKFLSTSKQFFMHVQQYYIIGLFALSLGWKTFIHWFFNYLFLLLHSFIYLFIQLLVSTSSLSFTHSIKVIPFKNM